MASERDRDDGMDYDEYRYECECLLEEDESRTVEHEYVAFFPECPEHGEPIKADVAADMARSLEEAGW